MARIEEKYILMQRDIGQMVTCKHLVLRMDLLVGEPKSRIVQKHTFFAPGRYTAGILYTDSLNSA